MKTLARLIQRLSRTLQTNRESLGPLGRLWRAAILVPIFGGWWLLMVAYSRLRGPLTMEATTRHGQTFQCCLPDLVEMYVYLFGIWEPDLAAYVRRGMAPGRTFVDVGAHIGYFSMLGAQVLSQDGTVVSFEPNSDTFERLQQNIAANHATSIRSQRVALADQEGEVVLYHGPRGNSGLATTLESRGFDVSERVSAQTPRGVLTAGEIASLRLIKIDVEGAEPAVMKGFVEMLPDLPNDVEFIVEVSPHWWTSGESIEAVLGPYFAAGFRAYRLDNNYWPWRYLWPDVVNPPRLLEGAVSSLTDRADIVLSRSARDAL